MDKFSIFFEIEDENEDKIEFEVLKNRGGSGFGFRVSGFGFRVSGFGFRVSGFGFRKIKKKLHLILHLLMPFEFEIEDEDEIKKSIQVVSQNFTKKSQRFTE